MSGAAAPALLAALAAHGRVGVAAPAPALAAAVSAAARRGWACGTPAADSPRPHAPPSCGHGPRGEQQQQDPAGPSSYSCGRLSPLATALPLTSAAWQRPRLHGAAAAAARSLAAGPMCTFATSRSAPVEAAPVDPHPPSTAASARPGSSTSSSSPSPSPSPSPGARGPLPRPPRDVVYEGPLSAQHKLLKRISIANTAVAFAAAPAIVHLADGISLVSRYGLAASLVFFGLLTTGALHWVAHPYVHELRYSAATGTVDVRTTTLLGSSRWHSFNVDDVQPLPWNRPVATFMARGQFYYIDVYSFPDEDLLRRLTPDEADVPQGYKDDKDDDD